MHGAQVLLAGHVGPGRRAQLLPAVLTHPLARPAGTWRSLQARCRLHAVLCVVQNLSSFAAEQYDCKVYIVTCKTNGVVSDDSSHVQMAWPLTVVFM